MARDEITSLHYTVYEQPSEYADQWATLVDHAKKACAGSYAPYSHFSVGAAIELTDGKIVTGANCENEAYPSGICAERVALWQVLTSVPHSSIGRIAIVSRSPDGWNSTPVTPCGACRQIIAQAAAAQKTPIRLLMWSTNRAIEIQDASELLPLPFVLE